MTALKKQRGKRDGKPLNYKWGGRGGEEYDACRKNNIQI